MPLVSVFTGWVMGDALANPSVGIFITPRDVFDISRNSRPSFLYSTMSIGRLRLPSSAIVVPTTLVPGCRLATGNFTSGVQRYAATRCGVLLIEYGRNA